MNNKTYKEALGSVLISGITDALQNPSKGRVVVLPIEFEQFTKKEKTEDL